MTKKIKILITTEFYYPYAGGSIFLQKIAENLAKKGHEVTVATSYLEKRELGEINNVKIAQFKISGNLVKRIKGEADNYKKFLKNSDADVMINFAANIWTTDIAFELIDTLKMKKILTTPGLSKLYDKRYKNYNYNTYINTAKKYDKIIYTSFQYRDKIFGDQFGLADKAVLIPNGAGKEFLLPIKNFREKFSIKTKYMILNLSNHYLPKGHWFVIKSFLKMNRKDATLVIIGNRPGRHGWYSCKNLCDSIASIHPRIKSFSKISRENAVSAFQEADLFLFGSKIECAPLVLYESMASKTPMISTNVGNISDYKDYVKIIKTENEMANVANHLLDNEQERKKIGEKMFSLWQEKYTWDIIVNQYEKLLLEII